MRKNFLGKIHLLIALLCVLSSGRALPASEVKILIDEDGFAWPITSFVREDSSKYFIKETYSLDPDASLFPWALTVLDHSVWVIGELSFRALQGLVADDNGDYPPSTTAYRIPINVSSEGPPNTNGPFLASYHGSLIQADFSTLGEEITTDEYGRVWFAQGGGLLSPLSSTNYSRVISYKPAKKTNEKHDSDGEFCVYNIPDDNAEVLGVEWDSDRDLVWFVQSSMHGGIGAIVSFKPSEMTLCANDYLWRMQETGQPMHPFEYDYCKRPGQQTCFTKYPLSTDFHSQFSTIPGSDMQDMDTTGLPAFLVVPQHPHPDAGSVWFTLSLGDAIGRLDPDTSGGSATTIFPIGDDAYSPFFLNMNNAGAWDIDVQPGSGDVVFTGYSGRLMGRFDMSHYLAPTYSGECESALGNGQINPCMQLISVPRLSSVHQVHQLDFDDYGNSWFSVTTEGCLSKSDALPHEPASIGFVNSDWTEIIYFDHLDFGSAEDAAISATIDESGRLECNGAVDWFHTGIGTDYVDDRLNLWLTDSFRKQIRRLEVKPEYIGKDLYCEIRDCS